MKPEEVRAWRESFGLSQQAVTGRRNELSELMGAPSIERFRKVAGRWMADTDNGWTIGFTGRTEREAFYGQEVAR